MTGWNEQQGYESDTTNFDKLYNPKYQQNQNFIPTTAAQLLSSQTLLGGFDDSYDSPMSSTSNLNSGFFSPSTNINDSFPQKEFELDVDNSESAESAEFVCPECSKTFTKLVALRSHETVHKAEKTHVCLFCHKAFARRHDMLRHERTVHSAEKALMCSTCNTVFSNAEELDLHCKLENHIPSDKVVKVSKKGEVGKKVKKKSSNTSQQINLEYDGQYPRKLSSASINSDSFNPFQTPIPGANGINMNSSGFPIPNQQPMFNTFPNPQQSYSIPVPDPTYAQYKGDTFVNNPQVNPQIRIQQTQFVPSQFQPMQVPQANPFPQMQMQNNVQTAFIPDMNQQGYQMSISNPMALSPKLNPARSKPSLSHLSLNATAKPSPLSREVYSMYDRRDIFQEAAVSNYQFEEPFVSGCDGLVLGLDMDYSMPNQNYNPPQLSDFKMDLTDF
ncbi:hypothetical protein HDV06_005142 [Boothiomyces sp. JEL0866]|nr:hypothetical protein HDV06_005142 [Boothiomyces sp. JEL0866]